MNLFNIIKKDKKNIEPNIRVIVNNNIRRKSHNGQLPTVHL